MSYSKRADGSIAWSLEPDDWRTHRRRAKWLEGFTGQIVSKIISEAGRYDSHDYIAGNRTIYRHAQALRASNVHEAFDEERIRRKATCYARDCRTLREVGDREAFARAQHVEPPVTRGDSTEGAFHRLGCEKWWRRALRRAWTRKSEQDLRDLGMVHRAGAPYLSDAALRHYLARQYLGREFLKRHALENESAEQLELLTIVDKSIANPALRRAELMTRARGFEEIATWRGDSALFVTLTCPSAFHPRHVTGEPNKRYEGHSARDAQDWLCRQWARARAKFKRLSIELYGFRVAEPHHDGTPHWHLLIFCRPAALETIKLVLRGYWLAEYAQEPGAAEHRCSFKPIDAAAGTAAGYLAKYVAKNIDGAGAVADEGDDESGRGAHEAARRVRAWASLHGIRQFQQVGGPPVGLYREFRRLRDEVADVDLERPRRAADAGEWGNFIQAVGGIGVGRRTSQVIDRELTGELNAYLELRPAEPIGVRCASAFERTRHHVWRVVPCWACSSLPSSATSSAPLSPSPASGSAWSAKSAIASARTRSSCAAPPLLGFNQLMHRWNNRKAKNLQVVDFSHHSDPASGLGPVAITVRHYINKQCIGVQESDAKALMDQVRRFAAMPREAENPHLKGGTDPPRARARVKVPDINGDLDEWRRDYLALQVLAARC